MLFAYYLSVGMHVQDKKSDTQALIKLEDQLEDLSRQQGETEQNLRGFSLNPEGIPSALDINIKKLREAGGDYHDLLDALYCGIGVHHAGLNKKYLDVVSDCSTGQPWRLVPFVACFLCKGGDCRWPLMYCRSRSCSGRSSSRSSLRQGPWPWVRGAVGALTHTIGLARSLFFRTGINMPCRSVCLAGDSIYLNAMMFRQTTGRAGRRGLDDRGNIFLFGIPQGKVDRLVSSSLNELRAYSPLTCSTVLRMALLGNAAEGTQHEDMVMAALRRVVHDSRVASSDPTREDLALHQFVYSLRYLKEAQLLDRQLRPAALAYMVSHIAYHEPASYVFCELLVRGWFDTISGLPLADKDKKAMVMYLLACIFSRTRSVDHPLRAFIPRKAMVAKPRVRSSIPTCSLPPPVARKLQSDPRMGGGHRVALRPLSELEQFFDETFSSETPLKGRLLEYTTGKVPSHTGKLTTTA